jgi:hypothetical protein
MTARHRFMSKPKTAPPPAPLAATLAPSEPAISKVNLAGFAKKSAASGKVYPVLPDPEGQVSELVASILTKSDELDALTASLELEKAELRTLATQFFFTQHEGRVDIASSIECRDGEKQVTVQFQNRYGIVPTANEAQLTDLLGDRAAKFFKQGFALKIEGAKIPIDAAAELLGELQELFVRHRASEALTATSGIVPVKDFHLARHTALTREENAAIERLCPSIKAVKTKGRGEDK